MRRAIVPTALVLSLVTALVLAELRLVVLDPVGVGGMSVDASANVATVRRFYDAVNRTLLTGDAAALDAFLAADFVDHTVRPGQTSDRTGLVRYLQALHRAVPALLLQGHDLVAEGDRVSALVRVEGAGGTPAAGLPAVAGRPWGTIDVFRLRSGRIAEHWGEDIDLGLVEPLLAVGMPVEPPATKWVELARLTYPPRAADRHWAGGPTVLIVESGVLTIAHDPISPDAANVIPVAAARRSLPPGELATLVAGEALVLGSHSHYETRNNGPTPAIVLALWSGPPPYPVHTDPADAAPDSPPGTPAIGSTYEALAGGLPAPLPEGRAIVAIGRIALAPGAALARHRVAHAEFVVVESGSLALTVENGKAWVRTRPGDAPQAATTAPLATGAGLVFDAGATVAIAPAGNDPLVALVISISPEVDGSS
jgi:ketosteroid isomerase-like protein